MNVGASLSSIGIFPNCCRWLGSSNYNKALSLSWVPSWRMMSSASSATSTSIASPTERPVVEPLKPKQQPWLIVGLGNPGKKFQSTRHNVGFEMVDAIAEAEGISISSVSFRALLGKGFIGDIPVMLAKPQTFMNASGWSYCFLLQDSIKASTRDF